MDKVIFKTVKHGDFKGDVEAFLPDNEVNYGNICVYAHTGQHSEASLDYFTSSRLRASTPTEYADLLRELKAIGYNPRIYKRLQYHWLNWLNK